MTIKHVSYREESKKDYGQRMEENGNLCMDQLRTGALLRIADATEKMASNYKKLQDDLEWYKKRYRDASADNNHLWNVIRGLRGAVKRAKKAKR